MGQATGATLIHKQTETLSLVSQDTGEKVFLNRKTGQEYIVVSRLTSNNEVSFEEWLARRKGLEGEFVPRLLEYGRGGSSYCSDVRVMQMLFQHPVKSLGEQMESREQLGEWFGCGEVLMIAYCALSALQTYLTLGDTYEVTVDGESLYVANQGNIILSDLDGFRQHRRRHSFRREISSFTVQKTAMAQLGNLLDRIAQKIEDNSTAGLWQFISGLRFGEFGSFDEALSTLSTFRQQPSSQYNSNPSTTCLSKKNFCEGATCQMVRQPLKEVEENTGGIKSVCYLMKKKKKENRCQQYKMLFQQGKTDAFAQEPADLYDQNNTLRLDEISSIHERPHETEEEEDIIEPQDNMLVPAIQSAGVVPVGLPKIELFVDSRPERLKQLVLNQKGIIYEESEISSIPSQRTHRLRNISSYNE